MDQRKECGVEVDMISNLSEDVLVHILSSLPLKSSAATSILSRRWLHLWKYTTKLIFREDDLAKYVYVNWVNSVLKSHRATSLQEFTIEFRTFDCNPHDVAKWLEFAFSRRVETLEINLHGFMWYTPEYDHQIKLQKIIKLLSNTDMRSLKVLRLLENKTDADCILFFLEKCPLLEELVIRRVTIVSDYAHRFIREEEEVLNVGCRPVFRHSCLKRLKLLWPCLQDSRCDNLIELVRYRLVGVKMVQICRAACYGLRWMTMIAFVRRRLLNERVLKTRRE